MMECCRIGPDVAILWPAIPRWLVASQPSERREREKRERERERNQDPARKRVERDASRHGDDVFYRQRCLSAAHRGAHAGTGRIDTGVLLRLFTLLLHSRSISRPVSSVRHDLSVCSIVLDVLSCVCGWKRKKKSWSTSRCSSLLTHRDTTVCALSSQFVSVSADVGVESVVVKVLPAVS